MTRIVRGQLIALFAFDIGYEVSLENLASFFSAAPVQPLSRKRQTPPHLQYARSPVTLDLQSSQQRLGSSCRLQATVFDFGVVSLAYRWTLPMNGSFLTVECLAELSSEIYSSNLEIDARKDVTSLVERIRS